MQYTNQEPLLLIPARKSRFEQELRDDEERWALHYFSDVTHPGFRAFREMQISLFTATVYPDAFLSPLLLTHRWMIWGFLLDDLLASADYTNEPANVERFLAPLLAFHADSDRLAESADPFYVGFIRFFQQITPCTSPTWRSRFLEHNRAWLSHSIWESENRAKGIPPYESEYPSRRLFSSGAFITTDLLEPCLEIEIPPRVYDSDPHLSMLKRAGLAMCWDNDLFSWEKERASGEVNNLVAIFKHHHNISEQRASERIEQLIRKELDASLEAAHQLLSRFPDHQVLLSRYISGIQAMITGVLAWHRASTRYASERGGPQLSTTCKRLQKQTYPYNYTKKTYSHTQSIAKDRNPPMTTEWRPAGEQASTNQNQHSCANQHIQIHEKPPFKGKDTRQMGYKTVCRWRTS